MLWAQNSCRKCGNQEKQERRGVLTFQEDGSIAHCENCGQDHLVVRYPDRTEFVLLERGSAA